MAATHKTIEALKRLAERPGYPHEGALAKQRLAELRKDKPELFSRNTAADIIRAYWQSATPHPLQTWKCPCGHVCSIGAHCPNHEAHEAVRAKTAATFNKGDRVFYNRWAYEPNCAATVMGYPKPDGVNWGWIRLKFDHLKASRNVPIYSEKGVHLSHEPLAMFDALWLIQP